MTDYEKYSTQNLFLSFLDLVKIAVTSTVCKYYKCFKKCKTLICKYKFIFLTLRSIVPFIFCSIKSRKEWVRHESKIKAQNQQSNTPFILPSMPLLPLLCFDSPVAKLEANLMDLITYLTLIPGPLSSCISWTARYGTAVPQGQIFQCGFSAWDFCNFRDLKVTM